MSGDLHETFSSVWGGNFLSPECWVLFIFKMNSLRYTSAFHHRPVSKELLLRSTDRVLFIRLIYGYRIIRQFVSSIREWTTHAFQERWIWSKWRNSLIHAWNALKVWNSRTLPWTSVSLTKPHRSTVFLLPLLIGGWTCSVHRSTVEGVLNATSSPRELLKHSPTHSLTHSDHGDFCVTLTARARVVLCRKFSSFVSSFKLPSSISIHCDSPRSGSPPQTAYGTGSHNNSTAQHSTAQHRLTHVCDH